MELPGYPAALDALRTAGGRLTPVPMNGDGWDIETLEAAAETHRPTLAYLMPDFHNPTGLVMGPAARRRAMRALERAGTLTVIDEKFVELDLDGVALPPPAASFRGRRTVTIGSLSKSLWGGLRVGWARTDTELIQRLAAVRAATDLAGSRSRWPRSSSTARSRSWPS